MLKFSTPNPIQCHKKYQKNSTNAIQPPEPDKCKFKNHRQDLQRSLLNRLRVFPHSSCNRARDTGFETRD